MADIGIMTMAHALARHAADRQGLIARNVANADTPGYGARDLVPFAETLESMGALRTTRPGHLDHGIGNPSAQATERGGEPAPNGNTVSVEMEMMEAASARQQHEMALSVYDTARQILTTALGRNR